MLPAVPKKPIAMIQDVVEDDKELLGHLMIVASKVAQQENLGTGYRFVLLNYDHTQGEGEYGGRASGYTSLML